MCAIPQRCFKGETVLLLHHKVSTSSNEQYSKYKKQPCNQPWALFGYWLCWQIYVKFCKFFFLHKNVLTKLRLTTAWCEAMTQDFKID